VARELFLTPLFSVAFSARPRLAILEESVAKVQRPAGAPGSIKGVRMILQPSSAAFRGAAG
jgi:hypothetical protein